MLGSGKAKYIRISARKARLVADLIRGKSVEEACYILDNINKNTCVPIKRALNSVFANVNCSKQEKMLEKDVYISKIKIDEGPMFKRFRAATMGRASAIRHRTAHISIEVDAMKSEKG